MAISDVVQRSKQRVGSMLKDKWHLDGLLGVGGSASVFAATHRNQTRAAIKLLHPELSNETAFVKRFLREGYVANTVKHPGVVAVLDDDRTEEGLVFLVMELLEGATLERRLRKEPILPTKDAVDIIERLLDILAAAHEKSIVHRDIKPANIFVTTDGTIKLLDFGIARVNDLSNVGDETAQGLALGTPAYMSPEQARGRWDEVDARSDLFSVGTTLWSFLSGRRPREGGTSNEELMFAMTKPIEPIESVAPQVSAELAKVIARAVAFEPKDRWPNAKTMQQALRLAGLMERVSMPPAANDGPSLDEGSGSVDTAPVRTSHPPIPGPPIAGQSVAPRPLRASTTLLGPGPSRAPGSPSHPPIPSIRPASPAVPSHPPTPLAGTAAASKSPDASGAFRERFPSIPPNPTGFTPPGTRLSDTRYDALGQRPNRPRPTSSPDHQPAIEPIPQPVPVSKTRVLSSVLFILLGFAIGFVGVSYAARHVPWLAKYLGWLPSLEKVKQLLHLP